MVEFKTVSGYSSPLILCVFGHGMLASCNLFRFSDVPVLPYITAHSAAQEQNNHFPVMAQNIYPPVPIWADIVLLFINH